MTPANASRERPARSGCGRGARRGVPPGRGRRATASLREAGVDGVATIVEGDAFAFLRERRDPIDFVFLDAEKEDYTAFLELIVPLLPPGGLLVADNLTSHADDLAEVRPREQGVPC